MNLEDYNMKKCKKCLNIKSFELFNKRSDKKDGFAHECRECSKKRDKINNGVTKKTS